MDSDTPELLVTVEPPLAWLIVNRPAARNALTLPVWRGLAKQVRGLGARADVRVLIVRGAGSEAFIAGADITEFPALRSNAAATAAYDEQTAATLAAIRGLDKPVIAMINGLCFGGGCSVALACDLRLAADHARFAIPAVRLGLAYPFAAGLDTLVHLVGPGAAADMLLSGRPLDAADALRIGLVNRVEPGEQLESVTRDYALRLADCAPLTIAAHKAAIHESLRPVSERDHARLAALSARCFNSADYQEGVAAFLAKRKPVFTGK